MRTGTAKQSGLALTTTIVVVVLLGAGLYLSLVYLGVFGRLESAGEVSDTARPEILSQKMQVHQREAASHLAAGEAKEECKSRALRTRRIYANNGVAGHNAVSGVKFEQWLDAGQCRDCYLPAFNYRPGGSAQYALSVSNFDKPGCTVEFEDPEFEMSQRDMIYYARAIQEPTPQINGANLRTHYDENGRPIEVQPCYSDKRTDPADDCLATAEGRAWSSPIFINYQYPEIAGDHHE